MTNGKEKRGQRPHTGNTSVGVVRDGAKAELRFVGREKWEKGKKVHDNDC